MKLPFSIEQFLNIFKIYNESIFPMQIFGYLIGIICIILIFSKYKYSKKVIFSVLAFYWIWMGLIYHIQYFSSINPIAIGFGIIFIIQGIAFLFQLFLKDSYNFEYQKKYSNISGLVLIIYGLIIYPILGMFLGHIYPYSPVFSVAPCPTTIFTFGVLLQYSGKIKIYLIIIPVLWSVIGFFAALNLGVIEDTGLLISGLLTIFCIFKNRK
ncbi:MAG TPA: DUF6064 family protein [Candidatus Kapabacteria bacterium]|nr:DUF6064 family protein [Candidatus Kapabacteria bacterium]